MRVDLHLHTWVSDGDLAPAELTRLAAAAGLSAIAITDHDTAAGVAEARDAAASLPLTIVPGIEISCRWQQEDVHVLGYWIDPHAPPILRHQEDASRRREERMAAMVARLRALGIPLGMDEVRAAAGPETRALGRPHLARALLLGGHVRFYGDAFARYIGDEGPAFVSEGFPAPSEAVATIHAAGGVAVWAHPAPETFPERLPAMLESGIDGVECFRPRLDPAAAALLLRLTQRHGLLPTGGSDWHGPHRGQLGEFRVDASHVPGLLALGGIQV